MAVTFSLLTSFPLLGPESIALYALLATAGSFANKVLYAAALLDKNHVMEVARVSALLTLLVALYVVIVQVILW